MLLNQPEFQLVEYWRPAGPIERVEWKESINSARLKSLANRNEERQNSKLEDVLAIIKACEWLADYSDHKSGQFAICEALAQPLSRVLKSIKTAPDSDAAKFACREAADLFYSAISGFATLSGKLIDGRRDPARPTPADIIHAAEFLIECEHRTPSKQCIRDLLEAVGKRITGKVSIDSEWSDLFTVAGLRDFPASRDL